MLLYSRAIKMLREAGKSSLVLTGGVLLERCGSNRITLYFDSCPRLSIYERSQTEVHLDGVSEQEPLVKVFKKFGPPIGVHISKRGYLAFNKGILRNGMMFDRWGALIRDADPESSIHQASDPEPGTTEYETIYGDDDEQPSKG